MKKTDKMKKFNPKSLIGRNVWKQSGATGVFKILEIKEVEPDNLKMEIGTNTYSMTVSYTMQDLIDLSKGKIIKDLELLKDFKTTKLKENKMKTGGYLDKENSDMVLNNNKQISHHSKELANAVNKNKNIPAWVVAKVNRSATDISDATHYLEGAKYKKGGSLGFVKDSQGNYKNTAGYELIDQFDGTYQVLDANGMDIVGEYVTLKDGKQAIKDYMDEINELAKGGKLGFCYSIGGL